MAGKFIIAVDLGGTNLKVALLNHGYRIIHREVLKTGRFSSRSRLTEAIVDSITRTIAIRKLNRKDILGIGVGVPGPVDAQTGVVHFFPNIPGWKEVNLRSILRAKIGLPIFIDNDVNLMALAEYKLGQGKGFKNCLCITLGTGVGGGLILEGELYRGSGGAAGEIGHVPINEQGPRCNCGGSACLEAYIGNQQLANQAKKAFGRNISLEELSQLARQGNKKAKSIWLKAGRHLGVALVSAVNLLNLDAIIIGGGVSAAGEVLFNQVREVIKSRAMSVQAKGVKVFKAKLGSDAGLIGAAILVKQGAG